MDSLVGYGSDDEGETGRYGSYPPSGGVGGSGAERRREDDTNYDDVNMDMSEESSESEPELPPAAPAPPPARRAATPAAPAATTVTADSRERDRSRSSDSRDRRRDRERDRSRSRSSRERRSPRRDERSRDERSRAPRRGLLGDRPDDRGASAHDARDAVSPRFVEQRDRRERDRDRERERDRDARPSRRSEERRSGARGAAFPPPHSTHAHASAEPAPAADYRPSSYKVNKKLEVMEKMGLQIKTPDGSMATARQLRAATAPAGAAGAAGASAYALQSHRALDQVQKRKLLWASKGADAAAAEAEAARWSGARFAQDADGKQVSKFMRLMGIKEPAALPPPAAHDPNKKQEELFQAMQAQYDVARATTHTMRGVGLGFQRGNF